MRLPSGFSIRNCRTEDLDSIIKIVNSKNNRASFGWIAKVVLNDAVENQDRDGLKSQYRIRVVVQKQNGQGERVVAFTRLYHRLDKKTTLHEIGVAEDCQSLGIGTALMQESISVCRKRKMEIIQLKTPVGMRSNSFYPRFGFKRTGIVQGRVRRLNEYKFVL